MEYQGYQVEGWKIPPYLLLEYNLKWFKHNVVVILAHGIWPWVELPV